MRIGELALRAGVNVQTVRFYERQKLLRQPERTPSGYRQYHAQDLQQLIFVKRSQQLGFTLREIEQLMRLHNSAAGGANPSPVFKRDWQEILAIAREKLSQLDGRLKDIKSMRQELSSMISHIETPVADACPASKAAHTRRF
ncbi:MAG: MerR family transcriptional regulator [Terriglobales bacterium]